MHHADTLVDHTEDIAPAYECWEAAALILTGTG